MATDYVALEGEYPDYISKDQLCRICHISKRKAKWLLEYGYIPCIDTGKKTHRFQIRLKDAIQYLKDIESNRQDLLPKGNFSSRSIPNPPPDHLNKSQNEFRGFVEASWSCYPDALTPADVCEITGYTRRTVGTWMTKNKLRFITAPEGVLIAKDWLIDFIDAYTIRSGQSISKKHRMIIEEFKRSSQFK